MLSREESDVPDVPDARSPVVEGDLHAPGRIDDVGGEEPVGLEFLRLDLDLHADLAIELLFQFLRPAPDLIAPFGIFRPDDRDVLTVDPDTVHPAVPFGCKVLSAVQKPAVFASLVLEKRRALL